MTRDESIALVNKHASLLGEHFDSVRVFVTWPSEESCQRTLAYDTGRGNFYASYGLVREWICIQDEYQRTWARRKDEEESPE